MDLPRAAFTPEWVTTKGPKTSLEADVGRILQRSPAGLTVAWKRARAIYHEAWTDVEPITEPEAIARLCEWAEVDAEPNSRQPGNI